MISLTQVSAAPLSAAVDAEQLLARALRRVCPQLAPLHPKVVRAVELKPPKENQQDALARAPPGLSARSSAARISRVSFELEASVG